MKKLRLAHMMAFAAMCLISSHALGQQTDQQQSNQRQTGQREAQPQRQGDTQALAHLVAAKLVMANNCEVRLAQMAVEQAQSPQVKDYAQKLIDDHKQLNQQLVQMFPDLARMQGASGNNANRDNGANRDNADQNVADQNVADQTQTAGQRQTRPTQAMVRDGQGLAMQVMQIGREATQKKLEMTKELLSSYKGEDFDKAFIGQQLASHMMLVCELQAINESNFETENLKSVLTKAEETTREHLETAKQICKEFEGQASSSGR